MDNPALLITSIGRNTFFSRAVRNALNEQVSEPRIVGVDASWTAPGLQFVDDAYTVPLCEDESYVPVINDLVRLADIDFVLPTNDAELLAFSRQWDELADEATYLMPDPDVTVACADKLRTDAVFDRAGVDSPTARSVKEVDADALTYPAVVKARGINGTTRGFSRVDSPIEFHESSREYEDPVVQTYLDGSEFTVDVLCDLDGTPLKVVPRERIALRAAVSDKGRTVDDQDIIDEATRITETVEPRGFLNAQCIRTAEGLRWIEINPRIAGGIPLAVAAAKVDELFARVLVGDSPETTVDEYRAGLYMAKHDDAVFLTEDDRPPSPNSSSL